MTWEVKTLGEVIKLEYGKPLSKSIRKFDGKYPVYGANGIKSRSDEYFYDKLSIVVGRKGSAGEVNLTEKMFWPLDVTYFVTFDEKKYDLKFLYNLLQMLNLPSLAKGVKPGINRNDVYSITVKMPLLPEQKRIVKVLNEVFEKMEIAKESAEKNLANAQELFESYLQDVFANPGKDWEVKNLGDVCDLIGGGTPSKSNVSFYEGDILWATVRDMKNNNIEDTELHITKKAVSSSSTNIIPRDNIIIATRVGLGKVCLLKKDTAINQDLKAVIPKRKNTIAVMFLFWWFKSISRTIEEYGTGATVKGVKLPFVKSLQIYLPPLSKQKAIVKKLDALSENTKTLERIYEKKLANLEELKKSVLDKAFAGEL